jgi:hypothetical protein
VCGAFPPVWQSFIQSWAWGHPSQMFTSTRHQLHEVLVQPLWLGFRWLQTQTRLASSILSSWFFVFLSLSTHYGAGGLYPFVPQLCSLFMWSILRHSYVHVLDNVTHLLPPSTCQITQFCFPCSKYQCQYHPQICNRVCTSLQMLDWSTWPEISDYTTMPSTAIGTSQKSHFFTGFDVTECD